jgi:hypothetical protein
MIFRTIGPDIFVTQKEFQFILIIVLSSYTWWPDAFFSKLMPVACKIFSGWLIYAREPVVISLSGRMVMREEDNYSLLTCCFAISPCCFRATQSNTLADHITTNVHRHTTVVNDEISVWRISPHW